MPLSPPRLAALLAALAAIGPFAIDTYLPAFPVMAAALGATPLEVQQTLSAYLFPFAFMALWHGALSDRFGRRVVIIIATAVFAVASLLCALAPSIEWLWAGRALQGMSGGAGMVVGRAVVRDLFDGAPAQRLMSRIMLIFALAPAIAPLIGGLLLTAFGWRAIFLFLALFGSALCWLAWRHLPETLAAEARQSLAPGPLWHAYLAVLSSGLFLLLTIAVALNFNGFFLYVLAAPVFVIEHLGLGATEFGWLFIPAVAGMMLGSTLSGSLAGRLSQPRTIAVGFAIMVIAALANLAYSALLPAGVPGSVLPIALYTCGMALAMPSLTLLALDLFPQRRGLAASAQSFVQLNLNGLCGGVLVPLLWHTPLTLAAGMAGFLLLGAAAFAGSRLARFQP